MANRPHERTDGRRKGYTPYKSTVADRMDAATLAKLEAMRGKPARKPERVKPERKP